MELIKSTLALKVKEAISRLPNPTMDSIKQTIDKVTLEEKMQCSLCDHKIEKGVTFEVTNYGDSIEPIICEDCLRAALRLIERG